MCMEVKMAYRVYNIKYDTDGLKVDLPKELFFEVNRDDFDPEFELADLISDKTGWCVFGFDYKATGGENKK